MHLFQEQQDRPGKQPLKSTWPARRGPCPELCRPAGEATHSAPVPGGGFVWLDDSRRWRSVALTAQMGFPSQDRLQSFVQKMPPTSGCTWLTHSWSVLGEHSQTSRSRTLENPHLNLATNIQAPASNLRSFFFFNKLNHMKSPFFVGLKHQQFHVAPPNRSQDRAGCHCRRGELFGGERQRQESNPGSESRLRSRLATDSISVPMAQLCKQWVNGSRAFVRRLR